VRIVRYEPDRRADVVGLLGRVWGQSPCVDELAWLYERNPVRPASVLLGEEDGRVVAVVAMSFVRMAVQGEELEVGMPIHLATDAAFRGRGVFAELQAANEERARALGIRLALIVPNAASAPILTGRLGWQRLGPLRIWARPKLLRGRLRATKVERFAEVGGSGGPGDRVLRDAGWLNWRFVDSPVSYTAISGDGYAVAGRRGRLGIVAAVDGDLVLDAACAAGGPIAIASPPPADRRRYLWAGFLPTPRTLTVLGKALETSQPLPPSPHFELGDLDFV
jgi:GNAT superfamily N-acetyltransferase